MAQELEDLRSQFEQQQLVISSLVDRITVIDHLVSYTAGTSDAETNPLVRLKFLHEHTKSFSAAADSDQLRGKALKREMELLKRSVDVSHVELHDRINLERDRHLSTMENLDRGLTSLKEFVKQTNEEHEVLKRQHRVLEERVSSSRAPPVATGPGATRPFITTLKGFQQVKPYNGEGGREKWK